MGLSKTDHLHDKRKKLLHILNIQPNVLKVLPKPNYISKELLAFVRIFNMVESELDHWLTSTREQDLFHIDCALDTSLEKKTWTYIETRLMLLMRSMVGTLEQDENDFKAVENKTTQMSPTATSILQYRILEKRILKEAFEYAAQLAKA